MKYNASLDVLAMALHELVKANTGKAKDAGKARTLAARLLAKAAAMPDAEAAIDIIEASNRQAHAQLMASRKEAEKVAAAAKKEGDDKPAASKTTAAAKRVQAAEDMDGAGEFPMEGEGDGDGGEAVIEADEFDGDPVLEVEDEEEVPAPVEEVIPAKTMAGVLARLAAKADKPKAATK